MDKTGDHMAVWVRLRDVSHELRSLYVEYAQILIAEKQAKAQQFLQLTDARNVTEREAWTSALTVDHTVESIETLYRIRALEEERDHLRFLITHDPTQQHHYVP